MNDQDFVDLVESIEQAGLIKRGEMAPSRRFEFSPLDIKEIRHKLDKSQSEFALMVGVTVATLQNWEQGRRRPDGPARALLQVPSKNPDAVREALTLESPAVYLHPSTVRREHHDRNPWALPLVVTV